MKHSRHAYRLAAAALLGAATMALGATTLSLAEAQLRAVERSRLLGAYDASVTSALEMAHAAGQLPDPVLRLGVDNVPADGGDRFSLSRDFMTMRRIGVMQEFTRSGKRALRRERYEREADRSRAQKEASIAAIQRDSAIAWLDRHYLEVMDQVAADFVAAVDAQAQAADSAWRAGRGSQAEVFEARAALALARDRRDDIARRARAARIELARWSGVEAADLSPQPPDMSAVRLGGGPLEDHLASHPEMLALEREAEVAETRARLASEGSKPDWTWEATYQQRGPAYSNMFSIGVSIPLPWDAANRQDREAGALLATAEEARARRDEMLRAHIAEVRAMLEEWRTGRDRQVRYRDEILPLAGARTRATVAAFSGAKATLGEVLGARRSEFEMRLQSLQLDLEVARLWARLNFLLPDDDPHPLHVLTSREGSR